MNLKLVTWMTARFTAGEVVDSQVAAACAVGVILYRCIEKQSSRYGYFKAVPYGGLAAVQNQFHAPEMRGYVAWGFARAPKKGESPWNKDVSLTSSTPRGSGSS